jgi:hypothetical protein
MPAQTVIKLRRDTAANWTTADSVLGSGEPGLETDTGKIKFGDGSTAWTTLAYSYDAVANDFGSVALTSLTNGDVLQYDGSDWTNAQLDALPSQTGESGNYLTTDGSVASWAAIDIPPGTTVSDTAPSTPDAGQLWWDSGDGTLYIYYDSYWVQAVTGVTGPRGSDNIVTASTAPADLDVLWIDTSEDGDAVLPLAGTTGQVLSKVDGTDYNTEWTDASYVPAAGTDDQVLTVVAGAPAWADAGGGGGLTLLSTTSITGANTVISSIPQTYKALKILIDSTSGTGQDYLDIMANSSVSLNYTRRLDTTAFSDSTRGRVADPVDYTETQKWCYTIEDYASTDSIKPFFCFGSKDRTGSLTTLASGFYGSNSAVSSFKIYAAPITAGTIRIYGVS